MPTPSPAQSPAGAKGFDNENNRVADKHASVGAAQRTVCTTVPLFLGLGGGFGSYGAAMATTETAGVKG
ncbi:hypothetical protein H4R35_006303, partial [Dimargaris xerosporica]